MDISIYMMANKMSSATVRVQLPIGNWPSGWYTCYHELWLGYNQVSWPHETMASIAHVAMLFLWQFWDNFEHLPWQHWLIYNSVSGNCDRIECDTSISLASGCCEIPMWGHNELNRDTILSNHIAMQLDDNWYAATNVNNMNA